jgi:hypothetical protein
MRALGASLILMSLVGCATHVPREPGVVESLPSGQHLWMLRGTEMAAGCADVPADRVNSVKDDLKTVYDGSTGKDCVWKESPVPSGGMGYALLCGEDTLAGVFLYDNRDSCLHALEALKAWRAEMRDSPR